MPRDMSLFRYGSCAEDARGVHPQLSSSTGVSIRTFVLVNLVNWAPVCAQMTRQNALFFAHVQVLSLLAVLLLCKVQILTQNCARAAAVPVPLVHRRIPVCVQLSSAPRAQSAMLRFCGRRMKICKYIQIEDMQYIQIYECAYACRSVCRYVCRYVCVNVCM